MRSVVAGVAVDDGFNRIMLYIVIWSEIAGRARVQHHVSYGLGKIAQKTGNGVLHFLTQRAID